MSYLIGWTAVLAIVAVVVLVLRKVGPPGAEGPDPRAGGRPCCNTPPQVPGAPPARRRRTV